MNLLMIAPLLDSRGNLRYFIGAQVDVSGLVKDCTDLDAFRHYIDVQEGRAPPDEEKDEFQVLSEMFNMQELETVRRHGGNMHRETVEEDDAMSVRGGPQAPRPRILIKDTGDYGDQSPRRDVPLNMSEGKLQGVYKHVCSPRSRCYIDTADSSVVPAHPAGALAAHPLRVTVATRPRDPAVPLSRPHWRQHPRA
jgi:hypothetical protein